jgi:hypothetical protein
MGDAIPDYLQARYPRLNSACSTYKLVLTNIDGEFYYFTPVRTNGSPPSETETGEIVVELDWSAISGVDGATSSWGSTSNVAFAVSQILLATNSFPELQGHPAVEFPIHLIGHSRGGSLMAQLSYDLGTNGIWVDHLTTLDPYPLNNDGNFDLPLTVEDASAANTYETVLFADNCWQDLGEGAYVGDPIGEPVDGAYVRQLFDLSGGYTGLSWAHENVHLWYYGTINLNTPADDTEATITSTQRADWWVPYEDSGGIAGFYYSLIGGGDRMSTDKPLGSASDPEIIDGYNQNWDLGASVANPNRTALAVNSGDWPNIIKFDITGTNVVTSGTSIVTKLFYQYGGASNLTARIFLDGDFNPYNSNSISVLTLEMPASGTGSVFVYNTLDLPTTNVAPGVYAIYAQITDGLRTRYLYTPELIEIVSPLQPPVLDISVTGSRLVLGINGAVGQKVVLQSSDDLRTWLPIATNTLTSERWEYTNNAEPGMSAQFYRGVAQ